MSPGSPASSAPATAPGWWRWHCVPASSTERPRTECACRRNVPSTYIRNSVKATVDAYDGTVNLYQWDTEDPVLKT
ncbi:UPF0182 family protein, partial [Streptomyces sp. NPDC000594]|uniref:UPF0182 family protein n=1 Tax=Streptomyces sp. NPDC000594 TaxID=3154261 RepID=UPI0033176C17